MKYYARVQLYIDRTYKKFRGENLTMSRINTRDLPEWMNNFISTFSKDEKKVTASTEKVAEVNVKDLQKVVWNDETFYAMFDNGDATVLNEFGNTVTTIKGASNIEAVDSHLNGKQVVTSEKEANLQIDSNILEEELSKVSAYLAVEADDEGAPQNQSGAPQQAPQGEFDAPAPATTDNSQPNNNADQTGQDVNNLETDVNNTTASLDVVARFATMENQVQTLTKQVTALTEQLRGFQDPGSVYDLNVVPAEQQHFEESAQQSAQQIEREHSTDLTTMQGRVSLVDKIMEDIDTIMDTDETDLNVDEQDLNDLNDVVVEEDPTEEEQPAEDEFIELEIPDVEVDETDKDTDTPDAEIDEVIEDPTDDKSNKSDSEDADPVDTKDDEKAEDKPADDKDEDKKEDEEEIVKLNARDSKIFKERICPGCGEKMLTLSNKVAHVQGVYCKGCKTEYGVDTTNENIYKKA